MATVEKLDLLLKWFKDNEVEYDKESIEIRITEGSFGVYALKKLPSKKTIVKIPKEAILSIKTTSIANILEDESLEGGCSLALALMYEMSQKTESIWYGYLQSLRTHEDLPIFWSEKEKELLKGTEMEHAVYNDLQDLKEDYDEIVEPLLAKYPDIFNREAFTFDHFQKATTLVASRAFEVDAYHGNAMVPFADIFNHKSGDEHVHFETDFDVCEQCGALDYCEHQYLAFLEQGDGADNQGKPEDGWTDEEMELDDEEVGEDDDEEDEEECDGPLEDLEQLELNGVNFWKDDDEEDEDKKDTCDMVLDKPVKAKEEIYNTYGDHPSIALLNKYGFCYDNNQNDYISVSEDHVVDLCLAVTKENLRLENRNKTDEALEELAMEKTRPRWEFFLINEPILCPKDEEDEEDEDEEDHDYDEKDEHMDEKEQHGNGCCGDKSEQCDNDHGNDCNDHEKEQCGDDCDSGCCDGDDSCGEKGQGKSYFANVEGLYEDTLTCLLHIMFIDQSQFDKFTKDVQNAVDYFDGLAQGKKGPNDWKMKKSIYQVCKGLSERRNEDYLDESGNSTSIQDDFVARKKTKNKREYYALTCRMNEKKIIEKSISYYEDMIQQCKPTQPAKRKPGAKKLRKMK